MADNLRVSTDVACGNACVLPAGADAGESEVHFTPSPVGGPEAMWFRFDITAEGEHPPTTIRCVMHLVDNLLGGTDGRQGLHPVFKTEQQDWTRVPSVEGIDLPDGRLAVAWTVPGNEGRVSVALCYPYGQAELDTLTAAIAPTFRSDIVGVTPENRPMYRLSNGPGEVGSSRPGVYCLARQHAGETPGSWMLDGFLRAMAAAGDTAPLVWAVPIVDLDGVVAGQYGKDRFPWDFNRAWGSKLFPKEMWPETGTHPMRYEVRCLQNDMRRWRERCQPTLVLDFHAPVMCDSGGIYIYLRHLDDAGQPVTDHRPWTDAFQAALGPDVAAEHFARSSRYPSRWATARVGDFVTDALKLPAITFEVPYGCSRQRRLTRQDYLDAGERVAQALMSVALLSKADAIDNPAASS